ncbi:MAG: hypothetical protein EB038_05055 [Cyclobacteriaceae bacterium]|nr:hypothetical protein [Cyclobacteriaceae bacterium]
MGSKNRYKSTAIFGEDREKSEEITSLRNSLSLNFVVHVAFILCLFFPNDQLFSCFSQVVLVDLIDLLLDPFL